MNTITHQKGLLFRRISKKGLL